MKKAVLLLIITFICSVSYGQSKKRVVKNSLPKPAKQALRLNNVLITDKSYTPEELVMDFFNGSCVEVSNVTFTGDSTQCGFFWADQTSLGVPAGIMLASGDISNAEGPNESNSATSQLLAPGDALLESILNNPAPTYDAASLEFDFVASKPGLSFNYVFASEEYDEWVCSPFNDVFGFFISGPGFNGEQNVAIIPNTNIPVQINTINNGNSGPDTLFLCGPSNANYYISNVNGQEMEYDGYTVPISSAFSVIPGETYHAKLAITDVSDGAFDSGVFISFNSMCGDSLLNPKKIYANIKPTGTGSFAFKAKSKYATAYHWDFGDGTSSELKEPVHTYSKEGDYNVSYVASNYCCSTTTNLQVKVSFALQVADAEITDLKCNNACNGSINILVTGGTFPYTYLWSNGATTANLNNLCAGNYSVTVIDANGNITTSQYSIKEPEALKLNLLQSSPGNQGLITKIVVKGGTLPYTYEWSDGYKSSTRSDLKKGDGFTVKVTDKNGCLQEIKQSGNQGDILKYKAGFSSKIVGRELTLNSFNLEKNKAEISIFNAMGQRLYKSTIEGDASLNINAGNWISGIYFIQMITSDEIVQKTMFIR